jgi:hypothetical protein
MSRVQPMKTEDIKRKTLALIGEVDEAELCCRMLEAAGNMKRPVGATAREALAGLDPESQKWIKLQARAALTYMAECFQNSVRPT